MNESPLPEMDERRAAKLDAPLPSRRWAGRWIAWMFVPSAAGLAAWLLAGILREPLPGAFTAFTLIYPFFALPWVAWCAGRIADGLLEKNRRIAARFAAGVSIWLAVTALNALILAGVIRTAGGVFVFPS